MSRWTIRDVMSSRVVSVNEETSFREIVDLMEMRSVGAIPVVDGYLRVVGIISESDLLPKVRYAGDDAGRHLFDSHAHREAREKAVAAVARDLMSAPAVTVPVGTSVVHAVRLMDYAGVKRLPVVDDLGRLVGIVTGRDLLKVFLRTDDEIRADVRDEVSSRVDCLRLRVDVVGGLVTLTGEVSRRSMVPIAVRLAERVDGVVEVVDQLTYRRDDSVLRSVPETMVRF
jgi:CBS-domain-containing membrane protein